MITLLFLASVAIAATTDDIAVRIGEIAAKDDAGRIVYAINNSQEAKSARISIDEIDVNGRTHRQESWITVPGSSELPISSTRPIADFRKIVSASYRVIESGPVQTASDNKTLGAID